MTITDIVYQRNVIKLKLCFRQRNKNINITEQNEQPNERPVTSYIVISANNTAIFIAQSNWECHTDIDIRPSC